MTQPWPAWETKGESARVRDAHAAGEPPQLRELLALAGCPLDELWPTVYSARVCAMAVQEGHAFVHHERRIWTPLPPSLAPDATSANEGWVDGPVWQAGVLEIPKYFGAFLDAPLAVYDPNHRHKWRAHELLHRRAGFSWAPDMTPFEAYLGARLSELLPIVHWYGLDEVGRGSWAGPISVGAAVLSDEDRNAGELLKRADERLYQAKNSGRNRVCA